MQLEADRCAASLNRVHDFHYVPGDSKGLDSATVLRLAAQLDESHEQSSKRALETRHMRRHTLETAALETAALVRDFGRIAAAVCVADQQSSEPDLATIVQDELRGQRSATVQVRLSKDGSMRPASCVLEGAVDMAACPETPITASGPTLAAARSPETPVAPASPWALVRSMELPSKKQLDDPRFWARRCCCREHWGNVGPWLHLRCRSSGWALRCARLTRSQLRRVHWAE